MVVVVGAFSEFFEIRARKCDLIFKFGRILLPEFREIGKGRQGDGSGAGSWGFGVGGFSWGKGFLRVAGKTFFE